MRLVLFYLLVLVAAIGGALWLAALPGQVAIQAGGYHLDTSVPVGLAVLAIGFAVLYAVLRGLGGLMRLPRRLRRARRARQDRVGQRAVTTALVALAAGDAAAARHAAARARKTLGDTPQSLLLAAQAGQLAGQDGEAEAAFRSLTARDDAAFLGWRGLMRQAIARQDWDAAALLARRAEEAHPGAAWLRAERARLALRVGAWGDALRLSDPRPDQPAIQAGLAAAASDQAEDATEARQLARLAFESDPSLTGAAVAYVRRLRESGGSRRVDEVLRRAWTANPHPDLAAAALESVSGQAARLQTATRLTRGLPEHTESHLLLARESLGAGLLGEARRHTDLAQHAGLSQRRLWLLRADIAAQSGFSEAAQAEQQEALRQAATAAPDPEWRCQSCGAPQKGWHPVCTQCHTPGGITWTATA